MTSTTCTTTTCPVNTVTSATSGTITTGHTVQTKFTAGGGFDEYTEKTITNKPYSSFSSPAEAALHTFNNNEKIKKAANKFIETLASSSPDEHEIGKLIMTKKILFSVLKNHKSIQKRGCALYSAEQEFYSEFKKCCIQFNINMNASDLGSYSEAQFKEVVSLSTSYNNKQAVLEIKLEKMSEIFFKNVFDNLLTDFAEQPVMSINIESYKKLLTDLDPNSNCLCRKMTKSDVTNELRMKIKFKHSNKFPTYKELIHPEVFKFTAISSISSDKVPKEVANIITTYFKTLVSPGVAKLTAFYNELNKPFCFVEADGKTRDQAMEDIIG